MHPFGNVVCKIAVPGAIVLDALKSGVVEAAGSRRPISAGLGDDVDGRSRRRRPASRVSDVDGRRRSRSTSDRIYTVAISDYLLNGGDGYDMFAGERVLVGPESGPLIAMALEKYIAARGDSEPAVEGRIMITR